MIFYVMYLPEKCAVFFNAFCRKSLKMSKRAVGRSPLSHYSSTVNEPQIKLVPQVLLMITTKVNGDVLNSNQR